MIWCRGVLRDYVHALTRLLITLLVVLLPINYFSEGLGPANFAERATYPSVPLLTSLVPHEKLLVYQFVFDLVKGGAQDFLENIHNELPAGE
jgi:hypothetical protein